MVEDRKRNSAIELLRIISMILIVFHHFAVYGEFDFNDAITIPRLWYNFIVMGGKIGVNIFVLISGYFMCASKDKNINVKKILKLWLQIFFYSVVILGVFKMFGISNIGLKEAIKMFFPIIFKDWWFASTYFVMYLIHPYLNKFIHSMNKKEHKELIILMLICWSVIPTFTAQNFEANNLIWFITLYVISSYIRQYEINKKIKMKYCIGIFVVSSIIIYISIICLNLLGTKWDIFLKHSTYFTSEEKLTAVCASISMFLIFLKLNLKNNKIINTIASATFGVYLIHENILIRPLLWQTLFKNNTYCESNALVIYSLAVVFIVFTVCTLIDLIRKNTVEKVAMKAIEKIEQYINKKFKISYSDKFNIR